MFVLTKLPDYGNTTDTYSACGICAGIKYIYPLSKWTCSKPANIKHKTVTINMNIYENCDFKWKWRNLAYDGNDGRAHEFHIDARTLHIGEGCCEGMITKVETEWDIKRGKVTGDCVSAPDVPAQKMNTELTLPSTFPIEPTPQSSSRASLYSTGPGLGSDITTVGDLSLTTEERLMTTAHTSFAGESVITVTKSTLTPPVTQPSSKSTERV